MKIEQMYYSPGEMGFFTRDDYGPGFPGDLVPITWEYYMYLLNGQTVGFPIIPDAENGARLMTAEEIGVPEWKSKEPKIPAVRVAPWPDDIVPPVRPDTPAPVEPETPPAPAEEPPAPETDDAGADEQPEKPAETHAPAGEAGAGDDDGATGGDDTTTTPETPTGPEIEAESTGSEWVDENAPAPDNTAPDLTPPAATADEEKPAPLAPETPAGGADDAGQGDDSETTQETPAGPDTGAGAGDDGATGTDSAADTGETAADEPATDEAGQEGTDGETVGEWVAGHAPADDAIVSPDDAGVPDVAPGGDVGARETPAPAPAENGSTGTSASADNAPASV